MPRFFEFWPEFAEEFRSQRSAPAAADLRQVYRSDVVVAVADETAWPSLAGTLEKGNRESIERTGWGVTARRREGGMFSECLETRVPERIDPDSLEFEDPLLESRYEAAEKVAQQSKSQYAVFCKTGGPYLRAAFMRGQEEFLMDLAADPQWAKAFIDRVADHITRVGVESIRRFGLQETGIGIFDDACTSLSPIMGAPIYEKLFFPALCRMVRAYKEAGARIVFHHCDGKVDDLLEMWAAAGINVVHPLEARVCLHPAKVFERFGQKLAVMGGLDNCRILPRGNKNEIERHLRGLLEAARGGGYAIAPHSIGPDISVETMDFVAQFLDNHGQYPLQV